MQQCGFCSMLSGLLRRAMCVGSRRGSSESYYRELGDQDTLKIEDKASDISDEQEEINQESATGRKSFDLDPDLNNMTKKSLCTGRFMTMHKRRKKRLLTRSLDQEMALLDDLQPGQVQCILEQSVLWKFNAFTLENVTGGRCLPVLCVHLFHIYGLISYFKLDAAKTWKLFSLIEEGYHSTNPYHNSVHAADVTQAMHCFLQQKQIRDYMEPLEIMASLLAAIAHDMDHPGVNQPFLIATSNHLAALYRNTSVLENHHWRSAISCLIESGLLDQMHDMQARLESQISSLILATDITRQQEYLSQFKAHLDTNTLDMTKKEHRHLVLQIALKCADISNPCRPWEISRKWSLKVCEEFFRQGDYERKLNLPVTALCDRHTTSIPKIQTGFFKFVVTPLISEWHRFLQNDLSEQMLQNLIYNQSKWEMLVQQEMAEETKTEISDADLVDDDLETCSGTNISDSSELLLPLRRSSLNPTKQGSLKEQLRRFSVPLNVFQDTKYKNREKSRASSATESRSRGNTSLMGSEHSLHSQLSVRGHCEHGHTSASKVLSTEKLLPDSSIASITTPVQATRLSTVLKDGCTWKLTRQQTFPPLETVARAHALAVRPLHTSNEDAIYPSRYSKTENGLFDKNDDRLSNIFKKNDTDKTDIDDASESNVDVTECSRNLEKENLDPLTKASGGLQRESLVLGSQLRDNMTSMQLEIVSPDQLLRRRKSMPTDAVAYTPKEKKMREMTAAIPQLLRRTLSGKECWTRRRGSAPAPVAPSEFRGLAALGALRHSVNGGRRKPNPSVTCQQWLVKTYSGQDRTITQLPRRSSLPVEVIAGISSY
ncbi:calcium/calmodulin-dependent 3',5'-cyclic nucleotide phosphodiesterase 1C-like isoform X2 [Hyposmocoma kahamanoa]|uniref:calcium/calmodulin-dependent 3',5'-cyclic nucleotide phosphodiesterase 1C-like isoform X2 n=1 Tax=Hyposmocoma kahamanoa TaxID=1477025 RepID=UPI000E6D9EE2|nr:calcium/calmodulin-dependent 3',5'-cyclic nucleotide phosphodiesterase 1C-like isoform X2 [Hyposmocoma kahamanoa]